jgi:hypothetical protein
MMKDALSKTVSLFSVISATGNINEFMNIVQVASQYTVAEKKQIKVYLY